MYKYVKFSLRLKVFVSLLARKLRASAGVLLPGLSVFF